MSTCASVFRIPVDAVGGLAVVGFPVTGLALLVVRLAVGAGRAGDRAGACRDGRAGTKRTQEIATAHRGFALLRHGNPPWLVRVRHDGSANASASTSINTRPSVPIRR